MHSLPRHCEAPSRIYKPGGIDGKGPSNRKSHRKLTQGLHSAVQHDANKPVCNDERSRPASLKRSTGTDEKTSA